MQKRDERKESKDRWRRVVLVIRAQVVCGIIIIVLFKNHNWHPISKMTIITIKQLSLFMIYCNQENKLGQNKRGRSTAMSIGGEGKAKAMLRRIESD